MGRKETVFLMLAYLVSAFFIGAASWLTAEILARLHFLLPEVCVTMNMSLSSFEADVKCYHIFPL